MPQSLLKNEVPVTKSNVTKSYNIILVIQDDDTIKSLVNILENLEYYLHKYDNAIDFITLKGNTLYYF